MCVHSAGHLVAKVNGLKEARSLCTTMIGSVPQGRAISSCAISAQCVRVHCTGHLVAKLNALDRTSAISLRHNCVCIYGNPKCFRDVRRGHVIGDNITPLLGHKDPLR